MSDNISDDEKITFEENSKSKTLVSLPVSKDNFAEFITKLLGKPQTVGKSYTDTFILHREDISNIFYLLHQRITQQNESSLIQFTILINYNDGSHVLINSLDEFESFNETRPLICVSITLTWIYLIKFLHNNVPEKQQIDISFWSDNNKSENHIIKIPVFSERENKLNESGIHFRVNHTERTWGNDIHSLLDGGIKKILFPLTGIKRIAHRFSEIIGVSFGFLFVAIIVFGILDNFSNEKQNRSDAFIEFLSISNSDAETINKKLDFLVNEALGLNEIDNNAARVIFFFVSLILFPIVVAIISETAKHKDSSFILISDKTINKYNIHKKKIKRDWVLFLISMPISIGLSMISSYLFNTIFQ